MDRRPIDAVDRPIDAVERPIDAVERPIDAVYTYVSGADANWRRHAESVYGPLRECRVRDHGELCMSVRLLSMHCPWIRTVHVVHAGAIPDAVLGELESFYPPDRLNLVPQEQILPDACLDTCSSITVEAFLHTIGGLSEHFLYLCDDMMVGRPLPKTTFIDQATGKMLMFFSARARNSPLCNAHEHHNENARTLFADRFSHPRVKRPFPASFHYPNIISRAACRMTHRLFRHELHPQFLNPRRDRSAAHFHLLCQLVAEERRLVVGATCNVDRGILYMMTENDPDEMRRIGLVQPHFFCINQVEEGSLARYRSFCAGYLDRCRAGDYHRFPKRIIRKKDASGRVVTRQIDDVRKMVRRRRR